MYIKIKKLIFFFAIKQYLGTRVLFNKTKNQKPVAETLFKIGHIVGEFLAISMA